MNFTLYSHPDECLEQMNLLLFRRWNPVMTRLIITVFSAQIRSWVIWLFDIVIFITHLVSVYIKPYLSTKYWLDFVKEFDFVTLSRFTIRNKAWWDKKVIGCLSFCIFVCVTVIAKICKHWGHIAAQSARACKAKILPGHSNRITTTENSLWK